MKTKAPQLRGAVDESCLTLGGESNTDSPTAEPKKQAPLNEIEKTEPMKTKAPQLRGAVGESISAVGADNKTDSLTALTKKQAAHPTTNKASVYLLTAPSRASGDRYLRAYALVEALHLDDTIAHTGERWYDIHWGNGPHFHASTDLESISTLYILASPSGYVDGYTLRQARLILEARDGRSLKVLGIVDSHHSPPILRLLPSIRLKLTHPRDWAQGHWRMVRTRNQREVNSWLPSLPLWKHVTRKMILEFAASTCEIIIARRPETFED